MVAAGAFKVVLKRDQPNGCLPPSGALKFVALFWEANGAAAADALVEIGLTSSLMEEEEDERFMVVAAEEGGGSCGEGVNCERKTQARTKIKDGKKGFKGFWGKVL